MSVTSDILAIILKSVVGDKLENGLVKELVHISIDEASEKGINEITDFMNKEKSKIDGIFFRENMKSMGIPEVHIDYVVAEIKDLLSWINITDELIEKCKYDSLKFSTFLWNEYCKKKEGYIEY